MFTMRNVFSGLIILAALATAQNTGIVKGRVVDKTTKQPLLGANVFIPEVKLVPQQMKTASIYWKI
jgi:hypothetical protein